jgi:hypothetical protein
MDEGHSDGPAGCPLRGEVIRDGHRTEQRCRLRCIHGTPTGQGGPVPPTSRRISTDYVYVMQFEGDKIAHMTKTWNAGLALKELGWA